MPQFVVVQSKADYDREQNEKIQSLLSAVWVLFKSGMMTVPVFFFLPVYAWHAVILFVILHLIQQFSRNPVIKSYIGALFAIMYGLTGILVIFSGIVSVATPGLFQGVLLLFAAGAVLLYLSYKNIKKYTTLLSYRRR